MATSMRTNRAATSTIWSSLLVFLSICIPIFGQGAGDQTKSSPGQVDDSQPVIICSTNLVIVEIEVQDGYRWPVSNLTKNDFVVFEDGNEQEIQLFQQETAPNTEGPQGHYEIGYYPPSKDGEFKRVRVRFRNTNDAKNNGLRLIHSPKGYYATFTD
jgi:hypothetical protein